jgi:hypothetical protein
VRRGARWPLGLGAALAVIAACGARAEVRPIFLGGCSGDCGSIGNDNANSAQSEADVKITMSLSGGDRNDPHAFIFDPEAVPAVLASGLPSALTPPVAEVSVLHGSSPFVDFEYVLRHPNQMGGAEIARALFLSVPALVGEVTLGDILSDGNDYFATQNWAASSSRFPIGLGERIASHGPSKDALFSAVDSEAAPAPAKASHPTFSSIASSFDSSFDSSQ